jgi:hypothetical protein
MTGARARRGGANRLPPLINLNNKSCTPEGTAFIKDHSGRFCSYTVNSASLGPNEVRLYRMLCLYVGESIGCEGAVISIVDHNIPDLIS